MPNINEAILKLIAHNNFKSAKHLKGYSKSIFSQELILVGESKDNIYNNWGVDETTAIKLFSALESNHEITKLTFHLGFPITPNVISSLQKLLQINVNITCLEFAYLHHRVKKDLVSALQTPETGIHSAYNLTITLDLNNELIHEISILLNRNKLSSLSIHSERYAGLNFIPLCNALKTATNLVELSLELPSIDGFAMPLVQSLKANTTLESLSIPTGVTPESFLLLCDGLRDNPTIIHLDVGFMAVEDYEDKTREDKSYSSSDSESDTEDSKKSHTDEPRNLEPAFEYAQGKFCETLFAEMRLPVIELVTSLKSIQSYDFHHRYRDGACKRHQRFFCYCNKEKLFWDRKTIIKEVAEELSRARDACQNALAAIRELSQGKQTDVDDKFLAEVCNNAISAISWGNFDPGFIQDVSEIKKLVLELLFSIHNIENALTIFKDHFENENPETYADIYSNLAHKFLDDLEPTKAIDENQFRLLRLTVCACLVWSIYYGYNKENGDLVVKILESIMFDEFTQRKLKDIITNRNFISIVLPALVSAINSTSVKAPTNCPAETPDPRMLTDIDIFCAYLCHKERYYVLMAELWRGCAEQFSELNAADENSRPTKKPKRSKAVSGKNNTLRLFDANATSAGDQSTHSQASPRQLP